MAKKFRARVGSQRLSGNTRASQAEYTRSIRTQMDAIEKNLTNFIEHINAVSPEILEEAFRPTFDKSQIYVPKDTHALEQSGYLESRRSAKGAVLEIGYGKGGNPHYAVYVHEMTNIPHAEPTRSKFLQAALEEDAPAIQQRIIDGYKQASGVGL